MEWYSPDFHLVYFWFWRDDGLGVVSLVFSRRSVTWTDLLLFGGTAAGGLLSARHIPLFAVPLRRLSPAICSAPSARRGCIRWPAAPPDETAPTAFCRCSTAWCCC
ncbi:MAG: hypothetical protein H6656_07105 [Ardenticatenaceae bacterium]|nr:hypothetical protein [Ardenticatenaceae bacterium]